MIIKVFFGNLRGEAMCLRCLLAISTTMGSGYAVVCVNSLHQLAVLMPASVVSYEVQEIAETISPAHVFDEELFKELVKISKDAPSVA